MVTGATNLVGIIGNPVGHSLSPAMHNAAFRSLGLNWIYVPLPVESRKLGEALEGIKALGFRGVNVTVPHKEQVVRFLDSVSPHTEQIGAANTITVRDDRLLGDNTDWTGILEDLRGTGFDPTGGKAMILGSGGSARAVAYALLTAGSELTIAARNATTAQGLVNDLHELFPGLTVEVLTLEEAAQIESHIDLIVNTTPLGMSPRTNASPWPEGKPLPRCRLVYDLVYNPPETLLLRQARESGLATANGLGMLVHQAAAAFSIWTGVQAPVETMREAAEAAFP